MKTLIGLDIGTSKLCAAAFEPEQGVLLALEDAPNDCRFKSSAADASEQDAGRIISRALALLGRLSLRPELKNSRPLALGVTGQMHGIVLVDQAGLALTPLINWQDQRGNRLAPASRRTYARELAHRLGPKTLARAGCAPASGYGGVTLLRLAEEGNLPPRGIALTIHDLAVRTLCGRAATDPTDAASWGIFDVVKSAWFPKAGELLRIPQTMLPEVLPTGSQAGELLPAIAAKIGFPAGLPVAAALGDNQASFIGSAPAPADTLLVNLGTGGQVSIPIDHFVKAGKLETRPLVKGQWLLVGASLCGGRAYQILEHLFRRIGENLFGVLAGQPLYERMNQLAAKAAADCGGIKACTLFAGARSDPRARGAFTGLTGENLTPGNLTRAVICGMIAELAGFYEEAKAAGARVKGLAGAGNAVRRNPVVRAELGARFGLPLYLPPCSEEAALGAALVAGKSIGFFKDWKAAGRALFKVKADIKE